MPVIARLANVNRTDEPFIFGLVGMLNGAVDVVIAGLTPIKLSELISDKIVYVCVFGKPTAAPDTLSPVVSNACYKEPHDATARTATIPSAQSGSDSKMPIRIPADGLSDIFVSSVVGCNGSRTMPQG